MKKRLGIWLDCEKAFLVFLTAEQIRTEQVNSGVETRLRFNGETRAFSRLGGMLVNPAKKRTERRKHQMKEYFDKLISSMPGSEEIYVFGPAETGKLLGKEIRAHKSLKELPVKVEKADKLTEKQIIARVKSHFAELDEKAARKKGRA